MQIPSCIYFFSYQVLLDFAAVSRGYIPLPVPGEQLFCVSESVPRTSTL